MEQEAQTMVFLKIAPAVAHAEVHAKHITQAEVRAIVEVPAKHRNRKYDKAYFKLGFI